ncbi:MAG: trypsin-like peptidase domain-containing protein [Saprospiraceae bacterium]|nr:trypsin-like peptidase domain-containing protein [Saprospiraceae bacterium]
MKKLFQLVAAGLIGGVLALSMFTFLTPTNPTKTTESANFQRQVNRTPAFGETPFNFREAAAKSMPAVVHIAAWENQETAQQQVPDNNPLRFFFGEGFPGSPFGGGPKSATGSGVIYTDDGYIVTNNHVVEFADELEVTLYDNRKFKATVIGTYPKSDLAVIKIDAAELPTMELGDSDEAQVGDWVLAVGNPLNLTSTVTAGIISAKGRDINIIEGRDAIESFIQTDAVVNPGNSGGALVDENGRLLGINTAISTNTGYFQGYSFAIPVNVLEKIVNDIIETGSFQRAYLGVAIAQLDSDYATELGLNLTRGVVIVNLEDGGSAQYSGLLPQDVIVAVDGRNIETVPQLQEVIGRTTVGDKITLTVNRKGEEKDFEVHLKAG